MALRKNPVTGQLEDDGQPAAAAPGMVPIFPPKPEHEAELSQRIEGEQSQTAAARAAVASGAQINANEQEAGVATQEEAIKGQQAGQTETALGALKTHLEQIENERQKFVADARASDATEIKDAADKHIAAGRARADYWKGNAAGEVFAALLRGIDRAASSFRGESGPTGTDRIIEEKISAHERALVGEWEASKEAHDLKAVDRSKYEGELARRKIEAANQSELEIKLIGARAEKAAAALGPERAAAVRAQKDAAEQKAFALTDLQRAQNYDLLSKVTNRSPTSAAGAGKLSTETRDLLTGAELYGQLAERNREILKQAKAGVPIQGPLATEFETNNKKMSTILQKPLGKSDSDASTARGLQSAPTLPAILGAKIGIGSPVENYLKALEVNTRTLVAEANKAAALEGGASPAPTPSPAPDPYADARAWLQANPNHPQAKAVRAKIEAGR